MLRDDLKRMWVGGCVAVLGLYGCQDGGFKRVSDDVYVAKSVPGLTEAAEKISSAFPDYRIILFGHGPDESETVEKMKEKEVDFINLWGRTTLRELFAGIAACGLFITNDSGPMHAAAALGTPLVAVFGPTNPETTGPLSDKAVIVRKEIDCSPCVKKKCPTDLECMKRVTVEDVYKACRIFLSHGGREAEAR